MSKSTNIPEISFENREEKAFEFAIYKSEALLLRTQTINFNPFRAHRISFYAIVFVVKGEGLHFLDFKRYPYKKGSIIFISKEQVQSFQEVEGFEAYILIFTENFLTKNQLESSVLQQLTLFNYHLYNPVLNLEEKDYPTFFELVQRIHEEFYDPDDFATEEIIKSSLNIFLFLAERYRKTKLATQKQPYYYEDFLAFQKLLRQHLLINRSVQFYAREMAISTKKLNRITHEIVGQPAKSYISQMLILEIKRFLINTSLSVKEIAFQTGFEAPTNMVKFFRTQESVTPAEFRKRYSV